MKPLEALDILKKLQQVEDNSITRHRSTAAQLEKLSGDVREVKAVADLAQAMALEAKHAAGRVSIDAEGNDSHIFAEIGSLKVVLGEHTEALKAAKKQEIDQSKVDARARRFWRLAQPAIIVVALAVLNKLMLTLSPTAQPIPIERPAEAHTATDAGSR